jgi:hypothetical protein
MRTSTRPGDFVLTSPVDVAHDVPRSGVLTWESSPLAVAYDVYLYQINEPGGETPVCVLQDDQDTQYFYADLGGPGWMYEWYVVAKDSHGLTSCSAHFDFWTK